jgi:glc operon protein GlcG
VTLRRPTKIFEDGINLMKLDYLLALDGIVASRGGIPLIEQGAIIGAIGCSGGTDFQDEIVSKADAAVINEQTAGNKSREGVGDNQAVRKQADRRKP